MTGTPSNREEPAPPTARDLEIPRLGEAIHPCPVPSRVERRVDDGDRVLLDATLGGIRPWVESGEMPPSFEAAGPRDRIFFDPADLSCGILTCGGLCPGLNNVVRAIVLELHYAYGVRHILGFRYGYAGLARDSIHEPVPLTPSLVENLHERGGTMLGSSRGPQDVGGMVDVLVERGLGVLFVLGGDGGLRGADAIASEIGRRGLPISVIGIPKTIDNDLQWTTRSFGFATAVEAARDVISTAHVEARAAWNGIGLVKLMGRHSGFIAAHAAVASSDVNFCLVPEVPFALGGRGGFLDELERRLEQKRHAVVVVAEGAGQDLVGGSGPEQHDASGNLKLKDVGLFLRDRIAEHFEARGTEATIRYFDPSYTIRSQPAGAIDAEYCLALGHHAVHAALSGRTRMIVGSWNTRFVHVPIGLAIGRRRQLDPLGEDWQRVLESTGQPASMTG
jgi:6-phosphofructokinase 1